MSSSSFLTGQLIQEKSNLSGSSILLDLSGSPQAFYLITIEADEKITPLKY